jgi:hypothetical protein
MHVDAVMAQFPVSEHCTCRDTQAAAPARQTWSFGQAQQG